MNLKKLVFILAISLFTTSFVQAQDYIGAAKCKMCHNKADKGDQYNIWAKGPHAKAMSALKGADATNAKCLKCHQTDASIASEGVSCESCHGPGSVYKTMMKDQKKAIANGLIIPDEKLCRKCHNPESPNYKEFNFKTYSAKIAHKDPTK